jgi:hypothetical protein
MALAGCADPTPPPNPKPPYPFGTGVSATPPWADDFASGAFTFPLTLVDAEQILIRTRIFALGEMPPKRQVQAFNVLLDQADAAARFRAIAVAGAPAGKLYALAALTMLAPSDAAAIVRILAARHDEILVWDSDVLGRRTVAEIVALIQARPVVEECRRQRVSTDEFFRAAANRAPVA